MATSGGRFQRHPAWGFWRSGLPALEGALRDKEIRVAADRLYLKSLVIVSPQLRPIARTNTPPGLPGQDRDQPQQAILA